MFLPKKCINGKSFCGNTQYKHCNSRGSIFNAKYILGELKNEQIKMISYYIKIYLLLFKISLQFGVVYLWKEDKWMVGIVYVFFGVISRGKNVYMVRRGER